jgi:hypothetical protein
MNHQNEQDLSHRQDRERKKEEHTHSTPRKFLKSFHPAWYVVVGVITCGAAVLIWTFFSW